MFSARCKEEKFVEMAEKFDFLAEFRNTADPRNGPAERRVFELLFHPLRVQEELPGLRVPEKGGPGGAVQKGQDVRVVVGDGVQGEDGAVVRVVQIGIAFIPGKEPPAGIRAGPVGLFPVAEADPQAVHGDAVGGDAAHAAFHQGADVLGCQQKFLLFSVLLKHGFLRIQISPSKATRSDMERWTRAWTALCRGCSR